MHSPNTRRMTNVNPPHLKRGEFFGSAGGVNSTGLSEY